ncbi:MAG: N-6 DNA methylase [Candidatus Omnitrophica bacterium]|nr:N-6 DNA methylase [Candidatus Omnitrophota bacterium]MCM8810977.1 N-6 DNA methylase [Candidatus Omnitrophota bacterium]
MKKIKYKQKRKNPLLIREEVLDYNIHQLIVNNNLKSIKKDYGMFFTPEWIVNFMVNLIDFSKLTDKKDISILEPACGLAQFLFGIKRNHPLLFKRAKLIGVEINQEIINYLRNLDIDSNNIQLIKEDYLLWQSEIFFDLIIGNPPYGIPSLSKHYTIKMDNSTKKKCKNLYETWYGKYNVYGAFIEKSIKLLKPEGQLIFIVPATFMILDEFKKLRNFLSRNGGTAIIYLGSQVFKPEANVSTVILNFIKSEKFIRRLELFEYKNNRINSIKVNFQWNGEIVTFETDYTNKLKAICSYKLGDIYDIKISPRTPEIKNNPHIIKNKIPDNSYLPILNGKNLKCNEIIYENLTNYWIKKKDVKNLRKYFDHPHIIVGLGFRENGRVAAAYDEKCYPWMGDVYHLLRKRGLFNSDFEMSEKDVVEYLNSNYIKRYITDTFREITYHLNITQLKTLPLPNKEEWEKIKKGL